jgi:hypothetical protein
VALLSKIKTLKIHRNQRVNQKNLKTQATLSYGPILSSRHIFHETVPLNKMGERENANKIKYV